MAESGRHMADPNVVRPIKFTYYGMAPGRGQKKPVVRVTRGSNIGEVLANVSRFMTRNPKWGAVVAEVTDEANFNEVLLVATYFPGEKFAVVFEQDVARPVCLLDDDDA